MREIILLIGADKLKKSKTKNSIVDLYEEQKKIQVLIIIRKNWKPNFKNHDKEFSGIWKRPSDGKFGYTLMDIKITTN